MASLPPQPPHIGPIVEDRSRPARFAPHELAIVLSHYDLGVIRDLKTCTLGSRQAPKMRITTADGEYLLKRRAPGRNNLNRVTFTHSLQRQLNEWCFPVPRLIRTRDDNESLLRLDGRTYELFVFIEGQRHDKSIAETARAGATLGLLHRLLSDFDPGPRPPTGAYHDARELDERFRHILPAVTSIEPDVGPVEVARVVAALKQAYHEAAGRVEAAGYGRWPPAILHGDWHPGNLLFRDGLVVAVLDFDSARMEPRMSDIANGVLQFSIRMGQAEDPLGWPEGLDPDRARAFIQGYESAGGPSLEDAELTALPWLIIEALVVESVVPIAATGRFAGIRGSHFLRMVRRKIRWLRPRAAKFVQFMR